MVKRILTLFCHRVEASRPSGYVGIKGLLQLLASTMTVVKQNLLPPAFDAVKELVIVRLSQLKALCMTSVPSDVRDGESVCDYLVY